MSLNYEVFKTYGGRNMSKDRHTKAWVLIMPFHSLVILGKLRHFLKSQAPVKCNETYYQVFLRSK